MAGFDKTSLSQQEIQFEESILRNPYNIKIWFSYLDQFKHANSSARYVIYERALAFLPRSYKLWFSYLEERSENIQHRGINDRAHVVLVDTFERALVQMHKMPRIWIQYCKILVNSRKGTQVRTTFDRALQALPVTQHKRIWALYLPWAKEYGVEEVAVRVYRRFLMYNPRSREDFVSYLESIGYFEEAARQLTLALNDETFISSSGQTHHQMWMRLCTICAEHPEAVVNTLQVENIIRSGISQFSDEVGRLWNSLADHYIRLGLFEKARDIYEEAIGSVNTVRDFAIVFDAYVKVEESILTAKLRLVEESKEAESAYEAHKDAETTTEIDMRLARLEYLVDSRPLLLNGVVLRQNPNNVHEWLKRTKLCGSDTKKKIHVFTEAIKAIEPKWAHGRLSNLYLAFAKLYEGANDIEKCRSIYSSATLVEYKSVDELSNIWCAWAEMEMRHECYDTALKIMSQAVTEPVQSADHYRANLAAVGKLTSTDGDFNKDENKISSARQLVFKNVKVWELYLDLEESLGSIQSCQAAYARCIDLKIITAQMTLNYASFLEQHNFFEDSFAVFERAVTMFEFPQVKSIWIRYLDKFMERYGGTKLERLRDLFEQSISKVPERDAAEFFLKYAKAEQVYGLPRHAMAVLDRAVKRVSSDQKMDMYRFYVKTVEQYFGAVKCRAIYESAIRELDDNVAKSLCIDFAEMEERLGEIDRARAVLQYGSQFSDPRRDPQYWRHWRNFEEVHGSEDTFKEMLRVQRSVETSFAQVHYLAAELHAGDGAVSGTTLPSSLVVTALSSPSRPSLSFHADQEATALTTFEDAHSGRKRALEKDSDEEVMNSEEIEI